MEEKRLALTFDDGPDSVITPQILDLLEKHHAAASFFLLGKQITPETEPIIRRALSLGCEICHHSFSHADLSKLGSAELRHEIGDTTARIRAVTGEAPRFFRPPYIAVSERMFDEIPMPFVSGYGVNDFDPEVTAAERVAGVLRKAKPDGIILLHDQKGNVQTVEALREILPELKRRGFRFVTMTQLFSETGITPRRHVLYSYAAQTALYAEDI